MRTSMRLGAPSAVVAALLLTGCAGSAGTEESTGTSEGFEYGATQEEVTELIADLEPVSLVYQPEMNSSTAPGAQSAVDFKEEIETRSDGKITIDIAWGQSIVDYPEVDEALVDGRIDIAYNPRVYDQETYPTINHIADLTQFAPSSPFVGELATQAVALELAWDNEDVASEDGAQGLVPITPLVNVGEYYFWCNDANEENDMSSWEGRQIRAGTQSKQATAEALGASPVSVPYTEAFEALQRNTVECTNDQGITVAPAGIAAVAPHVSYLAEGSFTGRASSTQVGGSKFDSLPLPYKQIIFDASPAFYEGYMEYVINTKVQAIEEAIDAGGTVTALPEDVQEAILSTQLEATESAIEDGALPEGSIETARESGEKWMNIAEELGYSDAGDLESLPEWYNAEDIDLEPFADRMFEETSLEHRPQ